jgi:hypothetical protein
MIREFAEGFERNKHKNKPALKAAATKSILNACHSTRFLVDYSLSSEKRNPLAPRKKCPQAARESRREVKVVAHIEQRSQGSRRQ